MLQKDNGKYIIACDGGTASVLEVDPPVRSGKLHGARVSNQAGMWERVRIQNANC